MVTQTVILVIELAILVLAVAVFKKRYIETATFLFVYSATLTGITVSSWKVAAMSGSDYGRLVVPFFVVTHCLTAVLVSNVIKRTKRK